MTDQEMTGQEVHLLYHISAAQENIRIQKKALLLLSVPDGFHAIIMQNSVWYQDSFMQTLGGPFAHWCPVIARNFELTQELTS